MQTGITLRDLVNAIPYVAIQQGLLTVEKTNKKNIFSGRILEIEGLGDLKIEQAFELTDASAERSSNGCTIKLTKTDSGISRGNTPIDAPNATKPEPAGKLIPIGKRVCESPPVPTVSGSSIGRGLSDKTRFDLDLSVSDIFLRPKDVTNSHAGYTLAQKIVGK
jgi:aconitase B